MLADVDSSCWGRDTVVVPLLNLITKYVQYLVMQCCGCTLILPDWFLPWCVMLDNAHGVSCVARVPNTVIYILDVTCRWTRWVMYNALVYRLHLPMTSS